MLQSMHNLQMCIDLPKMLFKVLFSIATILLLLGSNELLFPLNMIKEDGGLITNRMLFKKRAKTR